MSGVRRRHDQTKITRRRFVAGAVAARSAAVSRRPQPRSGRPGRGQAGAAPPTWSIVGAGLRRADRRPTAASAPASSVLVLEARDRVGGRVWNHDLGARPRVRARRDVRRPDPGPRARSWPASCAVDTFPVYDTGDDVYVAGGERLTYSDRGPFGTAPPDPAIAAERRHDRARARPALDLGAGQAPWRRPTPPTLDGQTLQTLPGPAAAPRARFQRLTAARAARDLRRRGRASCRCCSRCSTPPPRVTRATRAPSSATSTPVAAPSSRAASAGSQMLAIKMAAAARRRASCSTRRCGGSPRPAAA